jgi:anti-anti-sigma factor
MNTVNDHTLSGETFRPEGPLDIYCAATCQRALLEFIQASANPILNLESVSSCDVMGAQLLLAASKTAGAEGKKLQFKNVPAVVQNAWKRLGLPDVFAA